MRYTHGSGLLADRACGSCARSRRPARSRPRRTRSATRSRPSRGRWRRSRPSPAAGCSTAAAHGVVLTRRERACCRARSGSSTSSTPPCREAAGDAVAVGPVRLGAFATAAAGLVPKALASLPRRAQGHPARGDHARADPRAAGGHARPRDPRPDAAVPAAGRRVAAARAHDALRARAGRRRRPRATRSRAPGRSRWSSSQGQVWVASRSDAGDSLLGVWPGLAERPNVRYVVRDWLAKLQIVAAGLAITTLAPIALDVLPDGVRVVAVRGEPQETRRVVLARRPGPLDERRGPGRRRADHRGSGLGRLS